MWRPESDEVRRSQTKSERSRSKSERIRPRAFLSAHSLPSLSLSLMARASVVGTPKKAAKGGGGGKHVKDEATLRRERRARARAGKSNPSGRPRLPNHIGEARLIIRRITWRDRKGKKQELPAQCLHSEEASEVCIIGFSSLNEPNGLCGGDWKHLKCCKSMVCTSCFARHWQQHGRESANKLPREAHNCPHCRKPIGSVRQAFDYE